MNKLFRFVAVIAALCGYAQPTLAQWQIQNHSVAIGRGAGVQGFGAAIPPASPFGLVSNGATSDPSFQPLPNAGLANAPATTVKCNPSAGAATVQDCTIQQLAALGLIPLNSFLVNHIIAPTDCGSIVQMGSGSTWPLTVTLPAAPLANGFARPCTVTVLGQSSRGVKLSGFSGLGLTSPNILWPSKTFGVTINAAGAWTLSSPDGRWVSPALVINVDSGGNNANDGLATGTANAVQTLNQCRFIAQLYIDTQAPGNGGVTCLVPGGQSVSEFVQVFFPLTGGGTLIFQGNGGPFTWNCPGTNPCLQFGDFGVAGLTNAAIIGSASSLTLISGHNYGVLDVNTGVSVTSNFASGNMISCDYDSHFNINNGLTFAGSAFTPLVGCQRSSWNINGAMTVTGSPVWNRFFVAQSGASMTFQGNVTWTGTPTTSQGIATGNSVVNNLSGSNPFGGAGTTATGGQICTSFC